MPSREPSRSRRVRRAPDEARALLVRVTQDLLAERGPAAIGVKDIARAAGVSHGLITHYFGSLDALVEESFRQHMVTVRAEVLGRIAGDPTLGLRGWIDLLWDTLSHPLYARILGWAVLGGRVADADTWIRREGGLAQAAEVLAARLPDVPREDLEHGLVLTMTAAFGYALGGPLMWGSLRREATPERDAAFKERLTRLLEHGLDDARRSAS
ncbi:MAG: TetR/AcrR family transcriptional regulator [Deltaproteobacteria bacterium]|nr:TetR/AcrR family transcriptional regulator [Deltaproteobacteria bacterium]